MIQQGSAIKTASLNVAIKPGDARPIFRQIVDAVSLAIAAGELVPGEKLPSVRALAMQLSVNPNTVAKAYTELTARGLLDARQGLGLYVSTPKRLLSDEERRRRLEEAVGRCVSEVAHLHYSDAEVIELLAKELASLRGLPRASGED